MKENFSKYELYIFKEIEGELTLVEKNELEEWLRIPGNEVYYIEQKKLWNSIDDFQRMVKIDKKKALKKVERRLFGKVAVVLIFRNLERVAAILFIPLLFAGIWFYSHQHSSKDTKTEVVYNTVEVPLGMRSSITLSDGTLVWLNAGSSLKYPVPFEESKRQVELSGEAYFSVKKNKTKPFIVSAADINIKVLGTSFNCSAYPDEDNIETALVEGNIEISGKNEENKFMMTPGELATFTKNKNKIEITKANLDKYTAWKSGRLLFRDDPMDKVLEKLSRWYNVEFQVEDKEILDYIYSATFTEESLDQMLKMFSLSAPIKYQLLQRSELENNSYEKQVIKLMTKSN